MIGSLDFVQGYMHIHAALDNIRKARKCFFHAKIRGIDVSGDDKDMDLVEWTRRVGGLVENASRDADRILSKICQKEQADELELTLSANSGHKRRNKK